VQAQQTSALEGAAAGGVTKHEHTGRSELCSRRGLCVFRNRIFNANELFQCPGKAAPAWVQNQVGAKVGAD